MARSILWESVMVLPTPNHQGSSVSYSQLPCLSCIDECTATFKELLNVNAALCVCVCLCTEWCDVCHLLTCTRLLLGGLGRQHGDFGARLLDELLKVDLPQLLSQLLQLLLLLLGQRDQLSSSAHSRSSNSSKLLQALL